jgi:hypothetical protein
VQVIAVRQACLNHLRLLDSLCKGLASARHSFLFQVRPDPNRHYHLLGFALGSMIDETSCGRKADEPY